MSTINIQNISYSHPDREPLFKNISLQVNEGQKVAIVGPNGIGKTTLFRIICDYWNHPEIKINETPLYIPQHIESYTDSSIAEVLGINDKLQALEAISNGSIEQCYFDLLDNDWDVESKAIAALSFWNLETTDLHKPLNYLSGGERVKVFFSGMIMGNPKLVLLDEPTNHIDESSREKLYKWIEETPATLLIVSHDRYLLNLLTDMYELSETGIKYYAGNYDSYVTQKKQEQDALIRQLDSQRLELKKARKTQQEVAERRQRLESRGSAQTAKKSLARIVANTRKASAQQTTSNLADKHSKKIEDINKSIQKLQQNIDNTHKIRIAVEDSVLHQGKILIEAVGINYAYNEKNIWKKNLDFTILSGDSTLIKGSNGSGKTTLIKLITNRLQTTCGELKSTEEGFLYLDQDYSLIDLSQTVYRQAQSYNMSMPESEVKRCLTHAGFFSKTWDKPCSKLSGGEKMKLSLCSLLIANKSPDILILDEPTNNLDINSMQILSKAIKEYHGSIFVISHDKFFVNELDINNEIDLDNQTVINL